MIFFEVSNAVFLDDFLDKVLMGAASGFFVGDIATAAAYEKGGCAASRSLCVTVIAVPSFKRSVPASTAVG